MLFYYVAWFWLFMGFQQMHKCAEYIGNLNHIPQIPTETTAPFPVIRKAFLYLSAKMMIVMLVSGYFLLTSDYSKNVILMCHSTIYVGFAVNYSNYFGTPKVLGKSGFVKTFKVAAVCSRSIGCYAFATMSAVAGIVFTDY